MKTWASMAWVCSLCCEHRRWSLPMVHWQQDSISVHLGLKAQA